MELFAVFFFLLYVSQDSLTVKVEVQWAQSVMLPCQYSQELQEMVTVKWSRLDLNPNTVHQRREGDDLHDQNELFKGRTSMRPEALDSGDFSLTLSELQLYDSGNYTCSIIDDEEETKLSEVELHVKETPIWAIVLLVLLVLVLLAVSGGLLFYFRQNLKLEISTRAKVFLTLLAFLVVLAVCGGLLFHFQHKFNAKIPTWIIGLLFLLLFLILDVALLYHLRQQFKSEISTRAKIVMVPQIIVLLLGPAIFVGLIFHSLSALYIVLLIIMYVLMALLAISGDTLFHFQGYLLADISSRDRIFLNLLILLVVCCVHFGVFYRFQQEFSLEIPTWPRILLILWVLLLLTVCVGLLLYFRQQFMSVYKVDVDSEVESVLLPFRTTVRLPKDVEVTWTNNSGRIVHMDQRCSCNSIKLEEQYRLYRNRTEMKKRFHLGDFSLILKNPTDRDTDTYTCTISNSSEKVLIQKQVVLNVRSGPDSLIVAIDFGSAFSGYAFNVKPRKEGDETQIKKWSNGLGLDTPKTPTCILFDEHEEFMKFGYEAKAAFTNMREEEAEKHYFLEQFKTTVLSRDLSKQTVKVANDKSMTTWKVFAEVLRFLKDDALKTIKDPEGGNFAASDFTWVVTVPELLEESTKELIIKSATQAGLVTEETKNKLMFVLESEAALTWCLKLQPDGFITQNHSRDSQDQPAGAAEPDTSSKDPAGRQEAVQFTVEPEETKVLLETQRDGKRYLVVDCGDYSHFTVHDVLKGGALKTLHEAPKKDLEGQTVEKNFKQFLGEIFCDGVWDEYEQSFASEVKKIIYDFTRLKHLDEDVQISCPDNLKDEAQKNKQIETFFDSVQGASWNNGSIRISREKMRSFYEESLQEITKKLREILDKNLNIGNIVLVGGLAESQILRQHITDQFEPQYKVLCPLRPQEAILKGAVELGRNPKLLESQRKRPAWFKCLS